MLIGVVAYSQQGGIAISANGAPPDPSAMLDIRSVNKGFLMPRISLAERDGISNPALGLQIFDTTTRCFEFYNGSQWQAMICSCNGAPSVPGNIIGPAVYCQNQTGVVYSIVPVPSATSYMWSVPSDAVLVSGQGTNSIIVNFGTSTNNISVHALNTCGTGSATSLSVSSLSSVPDAPGTIGGLTAVLNNQHGVSYAIAPVSTASYYNWAVPSGATIATGQGTNLISVNFGTTPGNICVTDSNGCGNSSSNCMSVTTSSDCPAHGSLTFIYAHGPQTFTVPSCVSSVTIAAYGAQGNSSSMASWPGGLGGYATGTLSVSPDSNLYVYVGGQSGYNGGGAGTLNGGNGGGESDVRIGGTAFSNWVIVAGGGGGGSTNGQAPGGAGGNGNTCSNGAGGEGGSALSPQYGGPGGVGTCTDGGSGGSSCCGWSGGGGGGGLTSGGGGSSSGGYGNDGNAGSQGIGGDYGRNTGVDCFSGCGGGGGYYGGGGSADGQCAAGSGGGGSSWAADSMTNTSFTGGVQSGNGQVTITW